MTKILLTKEGGNIQIITIHWISKIRRETFDIHYLEKHEIKWVEEIDVFNENLSRGYRKDLKTFLTPKKNRSSMRCM